MTQRGRPASYAVGEVTAWAGSVAGQIRFMHQRRGGRSGQLITALVDLYQQGRFPFDRLVRYYEMGEIEKALSDSKSGEVVKPVLRISA